MLKDAAVFTALPVLALAAAVFAQTPARPRFTLGTTTMEAAKFHVNLNTFDSVLTGNVTVTSPDYDLKANNVQVFGAKDGTTGKQAVARVVAVGDAARGVQVIGHFKQTVLDAQKQPLFREYTMQADQVVYVPDASRPGGGSIDLTGHPQVTVISPKELTEPSITVADHITVLLGKGDDYPQIDGENGHMTLTPLQK